MTVFVVLIESSDGQSTSIHSVVTTEELAEKEIKELGSRLSDQMIATYEAHEVQE